MQRATDLDTVLRHYPPDCQPSLVDPLEGAGGFSGARLWRLTTPRGQLCLRCWPPEHPGKARLEWIHQLVAFAASRSFELLPSAIPTSNGKTYREQAGRFWELTTWMPGSANYASDPRPEKLCAALTALARFHRATEHFRRPEPDHSSAAATPGASPGIAERLQMVQRLRKGELGRLAPLIAANRGTFPEAAHHADLLLRLVEPQLPALDEQLRSAARIAVNLQPCLRDIWHDHVLFMGNEVSGIVDLGSMRTESVAADVARLMGSLCGHDREAWNSGLAAYVSLRPLTPNELSLVAAFDRAGVLLAGINWVEWVFAQGRTFSDPQAVLKRMEHILARLLADVSVAQ